MYLVKKLDQMHSLLLTQMSLINRTGGSRKLHVAPHFKWCGCHVWIDLVKIGLGVKSVKGGKLKGLMFYCFL